MAEKPRPSLTPQILAALCILGGQSFAADAPPSLKTETFDRDPGWEGHNNHVALKSAPTVTQNFGYSRT